RAYLFLLVPTFGLAQVQTTGGIAGTVRDAKGAVVVDAAITLENSATGEKRATASDSSGNYALTSLQPGAYELSVAVPGFALARFNSVRVGINQNTTADVVLSVASSWIEVTVSDAPPLVQSDGPQLTTGLAPRTVSNLPLPTRNFLQLVTLAPGV